MTSIARNIASDLVERRLWPVALVLVAAVIAIPVLLIKPASHATAPSPVASTPGPAPGTSAVSLANPAGGPVVGNLKNPFHQLHMPKAATASTGGSALGPASPGSDTSTGGGGTDASGGGTSGGGASPSGGGGSSQSTPHATVTVRFGVANGRRTRRDVSPGSPLPSPTNPLLVYLGQSKDGKAAFLVSSDAQPQGDGTCKPDKSICSTLYLKEGGTEFFDVTGPAGTVQYQLEVLQIKS